MSTNVQRSTRWAAAVAALLVPVGVIAATGTAEAAKGGPKNTAIANSIAINQSSAALGGSVSFTAVYPSSAKNPRVQVMCYQNGSMVWATADTPTASFLLGGASSTWLANGGAANCRADVFDLWWSGNGSQQVTMYASTTFDAAG